MAMMLGRILLFGAAVVVAAESSAQIPEEFENLQFFPKNIDRDELVDAMRHFSFALGVRCQHCHVGGDGVSFEGVKFDEDGPTKETARFMLRMTRELNEEVLAELPERSEPPLRIQCKTCHRGRPRPMLLTQEMRIALDTHGVEAAVERYTVLRDELANAGAFDFREWEVNTLAESLRKDERYREAIAIYELNQEYFPDSIAIAMSLGELYEIVGDTDAAIESYERVLAADPTHERAKERLDAIQN